MEGLVTDALLVVASYLTVYELKQWVLTCPRYYQQLWCNPYLWQARCRELTIKYVDQPRTYYQQAYIRHKHRKNIDDIKYGYDVTFATKCPAALNREEELMLLTAALSSQYKEVINIVLAKVTFDPQAVLSQIFVTPASTQGELVAAYIQNGDLTSVACQCLIDKYGVKLEYFRDLLYAIENDDVTAPVPDVDTYVDSQLTAALDPDQLYSVRLMTCHVALILHDAVQLFCKHVPVITKYHLYYIAQQPSSRIMAWVQEHYRVDTVDTAYELFAMLGTTARHVMVKCMPAALSTSVVQDPRFTINQYRELPHVHEHVAPEVFLIKYINLYHSGKFEYVHLDMFYNTYMYDIIDKWHADKGWNEHHYMDWLHRHYMNKPLIYNQRMLEFCLKSDDTHSVRQVDGLRKVAATTGSLLVFTSCGTQLLQILSAGEDATCGSNTCYLYLKEK